MELDSIYVIADELSVIANFLAELDEKNDLQHPIKDVVYLPIVNRLKELVEELEKRK